MNLEMSGLQPCHNGTSDPRLSKDTLLPSAKTPAAVREFKPKCSVKMKPLPKTLLLPFLACPLAASAALTHRYAFDETSGTVAEDTAGDVDGTIGDNVVPGQPGRLGSSFRFPAVANNPASRVTLPNTLVPGVEFTMSAFVRMPNALPNGGQAHIISGNTGAAGRWNLGINDNDATSAVDARLIWFHNGGVGAITFTGFNFNSHLNEWVHVGVTRAADGTTTLYLNGVGQIIGTSTAALVSTPIGIGMRPNAAQFQLDGFIDDVRFHDNALNGTEMADLAAETADSDNDGLPDTWEILYFDDLDEDGEDDTDLDGFKNSIEFQAATDPDEIDSIPSGDSDGDPLDDGWEYLNFGDLSRNGSDDFDGDGSLDAEEYIASRGLTVTRNPDGTIDNVATFTGSSIPTNANSQPDEDNDGLPDGYEYIHFTYLDQDKTGDADGDTFSNEAEFLAASNPARSAGTPGNVMDTKRVAVSHSTGIEEFSVTRGVWSFTRHIATLPDDVFGITGHPDGYLYGTTLETPRRIIRVNPASGAITTLATIATGDAAAAGWNTSDPQGVSAGPDGKIYFSTAFGAGAGEGVFRVNPDGSGFTRFITRTGGTEPDNWDLNNSRDLEWSGSKLYVSSRGGFNAPNRPLYEFDASGAYVATIANTLIGPQGVGVDEKGLLVTSSSIGFTSLYQLDLAGPFPVVAATLGAAGAAGGMDIIDINGDTYYVAFNSGPAGVGQVLRRSLNGAVTVVVNALPTTANDLVVFESSVVGDPYDVWAASYGLDPSTPDGAAGGDADRDGTLNGVEFALDLDPANTNSRFAIDFTGTAATGLTLTWPSVEGKSFAVKSSPDLSDWTTLEATVVGQAGQDTASWTAPAGATGAKFYRIEFTP